MGVLCMSLALQVSVSAYSWKDTFGTSLNGAQFPSLDRGGQVWVCGYDMNTIRVFHPLTGAEAPFSPISTGKDNYGVVTALAQPSGTAVDFNSGIVYVSSDKVGGPTRIFRYNSANGAALNGWALSYRPGDVAVDSAGHVFIVEKVLASVGTCVRFHVYNASGTELTGSPVALSTSTTTTFVLRGITVTPDASKVYITSETEGRVFQFTGSITGSSASYTRTADLANGLTNPTAVDVDKDGRVFVSLGSPNQVNIYNSNGTLNDTIADAANLTAPRGVAVSPNAQVLFIARFAGSVSLARFVVPQSQFVPIIGYHEVTAASSFSNGMFISPDNFRDQMLMLLNRGYSVISLSDFYDYWMNGTSIPEKSVVFTFDDNYVGELHNGGAVLGEQNAPGTVFAHTNYVGASGKSTWSELSTADAEGRMKTESHTVMHLNLTTISGDSVWSEVSCSRAALNTNLGRMNRFIAYPYGGDIYSSSSYSPQASVPTLTAQAGYEMAFSYAGGTADRNCPRYNIPRVTSNGNETLNQWKVKLGIYDRATTDPVIVNDDGNADGTVSFSGTWTSVSPSGTTLKGMYGTSFRTAAAGAIASNVTYTPSLLGSGVYKIYAWYSPNTDRSASAPFTIYHSSGSTTVTVDQRSGGYGWTYLGEYALDPAQSPRVVITGASDGIVVADALKFQKVLAGWVPVELSAFESE